MQDYVGGSEREDRVVLGDPEEDRRQIAEAARIAEQADVVLRALGGIEQTSREAWSFTHLGDRPSLDLVGRQVELLDAIAATGKPIVALVFNGAPLAIQPVERAAATIFECWYVGQETGRAVADVLFGDFKPGGKLPITVPRSAGRVPALYNYKPMARRGYLFDEVSPFVRVWLWPELYFLRNPTRSAGEKIYRSGGSSKVLAEITNTGTRACSEVVQDELTERRKTSAPALE